VPDVEEGLNVETPTGPSLSARMDRRAEELQQQTSERFPIPGYEGIVEVELRAIGHKVESAVHHRLKRVRDTALRELYAMADTLIVATVGFHEIRPDGSSRPIDDDWIRLAKRRADCPDTVTPRQALLFLATDKRLKYLFVDWQQWAALTNEADVVEELVEDFVTTG
jgi:hypothetical protein